MSLGYDAALAEPRGAPRRGQRRAARSLPRAWRTSFPSSGFYLSPRSAGGSSIARSGAASSRSTASSRSRSRPSIAIARSTSSTRLPRAAERDVALYTGNDDAIVADLLTPFPAGDGGRRVRFLGRPARPMGGLDEQSGRPAARCRAVTRGPRRRGRQRGLLRLLALGAELTDANAALFDPAHQFAGCIPGIHEVLRRQGLLAGRWCLDPHEELSPGQMEAIDRVLSRYPHLTDDEFVAKNLERWLSWFPSGRGQRTVRSIPAC